MKFCSVFWKLLRESRFSVFLLILMMTLAMFLTVLLHGQVNHILSAFKILSSTEAEKTAYFQYLPNAQDMTGTNAAAYVEQSIQALQEDPRVENVFPILSLRNVKYDRKQISLLLYSPEMIAHFSGLKSLGIDFSREPDGCVVFGEGFGNVQRGDTIELSVSGVPVQVPVANKLSPPYRHMDFTTSAIPLTATDLFKESDIILMQTTQKVMDEIAAKANRKEYQRNFLVACKDSTGPELFQQICQDSAPQYSPYPISQILADAHSAAHATLKREIPLPAFFLISSLIAFFSMVILVVTKKGKELSVYYLVGCSRRKCIWLTSAALLCISLIPVIVNVGLVSMWPRPWKEYADTLFAKASQEGQSLVVQTMATNFFRLTHSVKVDHSCFGVIFGFYGLTVLIAMLTTFFAMRKHSPLTYLRGINE